MLRFRVIGSLRRTGRLRYGVMLGLVALLIQGVVSQLPMPAGPMAMAVPALHRLSAADAGPCGADHKPTPGPFHHPPDCPVCQALALMGSLIPPLPPAAIPRARISRPVVATVVRRPRARPVATAHQPRAPPVSV